MKFKWFCYHLQETVLMHHLLARLYYYQAFPFLTALL